MLLCFNILALYNLAKGSGTQSVNDLILMPFSGAQDIVNIQDVIAIFIVVTIVSSMLGRFCQHSARIVDGLIAVVWIAGHIGLQKVLGQFFGNLSKE